MLYTDLQTVISIIVYCNQYLRNPVAVDTAGYTLAPSSSMSLILTTVALIIGAWVFFHYEKKLPEVL